MHAIPAGLPLGMLGMGLVMEGAIQHAAQRGRQIMWLISHFQALHCSGIHGIEMLDQRYGLDQFRCSAYITDS